MGPLRPASLRAALELLSRLPVPASRDFDPRDAADGAAWYPLVGLLLGGLLGGLAWGLVRIGPSTELSAVLVVLAGVILTGALHEDGLADAADGLFGGWTPARRLEIMRDSRLGTYGGVALFGSLALQLAALLSLEPDAWPLALVLAGGLSRWGGLGLLATHRYARAEDQESVAARVVAGVGPVHLVLGSAFVLPLLWLDPLGVGVGLGVVLVLGLGWSALCRAKVGGMTGDLVGAGIRICELGVLVALGILEGVGG